jgi:hypothetical protein
MQTSSPNLTRALLTETDRITLLTRHESRSEEEIGFLTLLPFVVPQPGRHVQVTTRKDWLPTTVQVRFLEALQEQARAVRAADRLRLLKRA